MLTKKDYDNIAKILATEQDKISLQYDDKYSIGILDDMLGDIITKLANYFAKNSVLFDREIFYIRIRKDRKL